MSGSNWEGREIILPLDLTVPLTAMIKNIVSNPLINSLSITLPQFIVVEIFWFYS
jgi:hypothetical protein